MSQQFTSGNRFTDSMPVPRQETEQVFLPSQVRIKRMCATIRRGWPERELIKRMRLRPIRWDVPEVSICLDSRDLNND